MVEAFFGFAIENPALGFVVICAVYYTIKWMIRSCNIMVRGWPPAHLDADGDYHLKGDEPTTNKGE